MEQRYCMPISLAYWTHCAPPQKVLPKRMRKIKTDLRAPFLTNASCMTKQGVMKLYIVKALLVHQSALRRLMFLWAWLFPDDTHQ